MSLPPPSADDAPTGPPFVSHRLPFAGSGLEVGSFCCTAVGWFLLLTTLYAETDAANPRGGPSCVTESGARYDACIATAERWAMGGWGVALGLGTTGLVLALSAQGRAVGKRKALPIQLRVALIAAPLVLCGAMAAVWITGALGHRYEGSVSGKAWNTAMASSAFGGLLVGLLIRLVARRRRQGGRPWARRRVTRRRQ
ncbi:MAG: hypothetical protein E6G39_12420 [Actinobacteria bacterium]|nr:MAG: hypothetical protein E6G39_12420 [Actinomycetota bacterium]